MDIVARAAEDIDRSPAQVGTSASVHLPSDTAAIKAAPDLHEGPKEPLASGVWLEGGAWTNKMKGETKAGKRRKEWDRSTVSG